MSEETKITKKENKVKKFVKRHKVLLVTLTTAGATGYAFYKIGLLQGLNLNLINEFRHAEGIDSLFCVNTDEGLCVNADEGIFTDLAPAIEAAVLNKNLEKVHLDRSYKIGDNLSKNVQVVIENVTE